MTTYIIYKNGQKISLHDVVSYPIFNLTLEDPEIGAIGSKIDIERISRD